MPWWGWMALGAALLGAEIAIATDFWDLAGTPVEHLPGEIVRRKTWSMRR